MAAATVERMSARDDKQVRFGGSGGPPPGRLEGAYEPLLHEPPPLRCAHCSRQPAFQGFPQRGAGSLGGRGAATGGGAVQRQRPRTLITIASERSAPPCCLPPAAAAARASPLLPSTSATPCWPRAPISPRQSSASVGPAHANRGCSAKHAAASSIDLKTDKCGACPSLGSQAGPSPQSCAALPNSFSILILSPCPGRPWSPTLRAGLLALPRVFALLGIGTATIWLIFTAALTYLSMHMLTKATVRTGLLNYRQAGTAGPADWLEACWMCCQRLPGGWHLSLFFCLFFRAQPSPTPPSSSSPCWLQRRGA